VIEQPPPRQPFPELVAPTEAARGARRENDRGAHGEA